MGIPLPKLIAWLLLLITTIKSERNVQYELRKEVRDRRKLGENVKISKGKVVQVQK